MNALLDSPVTNDVRTRSRPVLPPGPSLGPESLAALLPARSDPDYLWVLTELVRTDIEHQQSCGNAPKLDDYRSEYPEVFAEPAVAQAFQEIVDGLELAADLTSTPRPTLNLELTRAVSIDPVNKPSPAGTFPKVGEEFCGFRLTSELGRGAFARVFLAEQVGLAGRPVALKVSVRPTREPQRLAKLRHTNVVPIYSVHDLPPIQAVCMPFLGRQTLADLIKEYRETGAFSVAGSHALSTAAVAARTTLADPSGPAPAKPPDSGTYCVRAEERPARAALAELSHLDLVLWVVARLADGLAHAHDRRILHLDLKPANVLFADDGQPLLLDFNLSFDLNAGDRERSGGTLPYMAPEQLEEYRDQGPTAVDHRTDLFALGVIFFELLTGRHPYAVAANERANLTDMVRLRRAGPPSVRAFNRGVSPAVDAVVQKLLRPAPLDRYQSAHELLADLQRHGQNLPLKFAANTSLAERAAKWRRRHPRIFLHASLVVAVLAGAGFAAAAYRETEARAHGAAVAKGHTLKTELARLRVDLAARDDANARDAGIKRGTELMAEYGFPERNDWTNSPPLRRLTTTEQYAVGDDLGELAMLLAHAETLGGRGKPPEERAKAADRAHAWTTAAQACYADRTNLPAESYLDAVRLMADGKFSDASGVLEKLTTRNPGHYAGQFQLAVCRSCLGDTPRALERFQVARGLAPDDPRASFNRGLLLYSQGKSQAAIEEFNDAIERDATHAASYRNRAVARQKTDPCGAIDDLNLALHHGDSAATVLPMRAVLHAKLGDTAAAKQDYAAAAKLAPQTPVEYIARGNALLLRKDNPDPGGALKDYKAAAELNPNYVNAWQNQAHVLADYLHDPIQALEAQNEAVRCAPDFAPARVGRAVLFARFGKRTEAHDDAQKALILSADPAVTYQAACVYALTAKTHPADKAAAVELFRKALRDGYRRFDVVAKDHDVDALRNDPAFRDALAAAKVLVK